MIIEAVRLLGRDELAGTVPLRDPLPLGRRGIDSFGKRLADLPPATIRALTVLAIAGSAPAAAVSSSLAHAGCTRGDLQPAEEAEVIAVHQGSAGFVHPLLRAATVAAADSRARRLAHAAVAAALDGVDVERRAWHLAAATTGTSEVVASALEEAAVNVTRRAGTAAAATQLALAARLSPPGPVRRDRLARAGDALVQAGRHQEAAGIAEQLLRIGDASGRERPLLLQAALIVWTDDTVDAPRLLWPIFDELVQAAPDGAALVGIQLVVILSEPWAAQGDARHGPSLLPVACVRRPREGGSTLRSRASVASSR